MRWQVGVESQRRAIVLRRAGPWRKIVEEWKAGKKRRREDQKDAKGQISSSALGDISRGPRP